MNEFADRNPTGRFTGLAATYDRYRPDYPDAVWKFLAQYGGFAPSPTAVDVGCGTGISARQLMKLGWKVIGIEPNAEMREQATSYGDPIEYRDGRGENTGLPDRVADLVVAAQAFHWFRFDDALREFHRILKPEGCVAAAWNERDLDDPFTAAFVRLLNRLSPEKAVAEASQAATGEAILHHPLFESGVRSEFPHRQSMDRDGLIGRGFSVSFGPRDEEGRQRFAAELNDLFDRFSDDGRVALYYRTVLYAARARRL